MFYDLKSPGYIYLSLKKPAWQCVRWLTLQCMGRGGHCRALGSELPQEALGIAEEVTCILLLCWLQYPAGIGWRDLHYPAVLSLVARILCKTRRAARACTYFKKSYQWRWYLSGMSLPTFECGRPGFKDFFCLRRCISHLTEVSLTTSCSGLTFFWNSFILL